MVAVPWSAADFLHGPIAIVDPGFPLLAIAPAGPTLPGMRELLSAAADRGAELTVVSDAPFAERIPLEPVPEWLSPLVAVIPAQLLAVGAAEHLGRDVDRPTGLQKVTRTS
jgi:glucosamine--fructose-6-phosphate aminotransferase (isomerizing)